MTGVEADAASKPHLLPGASDRATKLPSADGALRTDQIEGLARRKYLYGQREPDGSVLIRTGDIA